MASTSATSTMATSSSDPQAQAQPQAQASAVPPPAPPPPALLLSAGPSGLSPLSSHSSHSSHSSLSSLSLANGTTTSTPTSTTTPTSSGLPALAHRRSVVSFTGRASHSGVVRHGSISSQSHSHSHSQSFRSKRNSFNATAPSRTTTSSRIITGAVAAHGYGTSGSNGTSSTSGNGTSGNGHVRSVIAAQSSYNNPNNGGFATYGMGSSAAMNGRPPLPGPAAEAAFISTGSLLWNPVNSLIRSISSLFTPGSADSPGPSSPTSPVLTPTSASSSFAYLHAHHNAHHHAHAHFQTKHLGHHGAMHLRPSPPTRQVLQSAEFYGVDFGPPPALPDSDVFVSARRSTTSPEQAQREDQLRREQGSVFISALNSMIVSRGFGALGRSSSSSASASVVSAQAVDDAREAHMERESRTSVVRQIELLRFAERSQSEPRPASSSTSSSSSSLAEPGAGRGRASSVASATHAAAAGTGDTAAVASPAGSAATANKWLNPAQHRMHNLDYSDVFPAHLASHEGITVFRIEAFTPTLVDADALGHFCVADAYIVLVTASRRRSRSRGQQSDVDDRVDDGADADADADGLSHEIYTWIGSRAEMDKKFCVAMYSVGLRNWIGATCRIQREAEGEESAEFQTLFADLVLEDESHAAESGLFAAQEKRYPLRLYKVYGRSNLCLCLVEPGYWSLKSDAVYILDWGLEIFQWNGSASALQHRAKGRMVCNRLNRLERVGRAHFVEMDEWDEVPRFWEILGGERTREDAEAEAEAAADGDADADGDEADRDARRFEALGMAPHRLYRVFPKMAPELESHIVAAQVIRRSVLVSDGCYVLDAGVELFLWIGKNAWPQLRAMATELLAKVVASRDRPSWVGLVKCIDQHEPEIFKLRFTDWDAASIDHLNWADVHTIASGHAASTAAANPTTGSSSSSSEPPKSKIKVDVKALYAPPPTVDYDGLMIEETIDHANRLLQAFTCFVYNRGRFVQLPEGERGHFFTHDAYVFLCVYRVDTMERVVGRGRSRSLRPSPAGASAGQPPASSSSSAAADVETETDAGNGSDVDARSDVTPTAAGERRRGAESGDRDMDMDSDLDDNGDAASVRHAHSRTSRSEYSPSRSSAVSYTHDTDNDNDYDDDGDDGAYTDQDDGDDDDGSMSDADDDGPAPVLECVVYFWQGRHASRLAYSTFKLKTQAEMEHLVQTMYNSPVRLVTLEQGKEPIALLAHLDNLCVLRSGSRADWLQRLADSRERGGNAGETTVFHIRTDARYKTTRAVQVPATAASLVSRDCFLVQSTGTGNGSGNVSGSRNYLWMGKGASKDECRRARLVVEMVLSFSEQYEIDGVGSPVAETTYADSDDDDENGGRGSRGSLMDRDRERDGEAAETDGSGQALLTYEAVAEKLEPRAFWRLLGGRTVYAPGVEFYYTRPPRVLRCSCSQGYFLVEELTGAVAQTDLLPDTCVILDPGAPHKVFVWTGDAASDVVRKLTRKSVEVWLERLDDGRYAVFEPVVRGASRRGGGAVNGGQTTGVGIGAKTASAFLTGRAPVLSIAPPPPAMQPPQQQQQQQPAIPEARPAMAFDVVSIAAPSPAYGGHGSVNNLDTSSSSSTSPPSSRRSITSSLTALARRASLAMEESGVFAGHRRGSSSSLSRPSLSALAATASATASASAPVDASASSRPHGSTGTSSVFVRPSPSATPSQPTVTHTVTHADPATDADTTTDTNDGDVLWIAQGTEPLDFTAYFHGWDPLVFGARIDPGSSFLREQRQARRAKLLDQQQQQQQQARGGRVASLRKKVSL